jgi:hypothetical protein
MNNVSIAGLYILGFAMMGGSMVIVLTVDPANDIMTGLSLGLFVAGVFSGFAGIAGAVCR